MNSSALVLIFNDHIVTHEYGIRVSAAFMRLSVFPHDIPKADTARIAKRDTMDQKVKAQGHEAVSVFRQNAILPLAVCISYAGFAPLQCPAAQAELVTPGFLCVTSPLPMLLYRLLIFSCVKFFAVSHCRRGS